MERIDLHPLLKFCQVQQHTSKISSLSLSLSLSLHCTNFSHERNDKASDVVVPVAGHPPIPRAYDPHHVQTAVSTREHEDGVNFGGEDATADKG